MYESITHLLYLMFIYSLYVVVGLGVVLCIVKLDMFRRTLKQVSQMAVVAFSISSSSPESFHELRVVDAVLLRDIMQLSSIERLTLSIFWLPYAIACLAAIAVVPFLFQMIIPTSVAIVLSIMLGGLFTFAATKDTNPPWLKATKEVIQAILYMDMVRMVEQTQPELTQSTGPE